MGKRPSNKSIRLPVVIEIRTRKNRSSLMEKRRAKASGEE
jgi:hypothetical protein